MEPSKISNKKAADILRKHYPQKRVVIRQHLVDVDDTDSELGQAFSRAIDLLEKVGEAVDEGYLQDWYIHSVSQDDEPVWTEDHISELAADFIVIPKPEERS